MRDALSLLDQAIAHGAGRLAASGVSEMLGTIDRSYLVRLIECVAAGDAAAAAGIAGDMQARSLSFDNALADLAALLLRVALAQAAPDALEDPAERAQAEALAARLDPESVQLYYQIALQGREDLRLAPDEHAGFLMTVLRMLAFRPEGGSKALPVAEKAPIIAAKAPIAAARAPVAAAKAPIPAANAPQPRAAAPAAAGGAWPELVAQLQVAGAARELARNAELRGRDGSVFDLVVPKSKAFLADRAHADKLKTALEQHLGGTVRVNVSVGDTSGASAAAIESGERDARRAEAVKAVQGDGFVQDLVNMFDGKVVDSTIRSPEK
jgi:DNA polymerase-3 subunit gamma/tau